MGLVEVAMSWWSSDRALRKRVQIEGLDNLESALEHGHGVILLGAHFTTLEIGGRLLSLFQPFYIMQRDQKNLLFDTIMTRSRQRHFHKAIHRNNIKELLLSLKTNHAVWYAPDQHFGGPKKVFAPFFGIQTGSNPATSRIAKTTGARVVPFFQVRLPGLQGYKLIIQPALQDFPAGDIQQDTARINQVIEQVIRQKPEQYLWAHKRFKSRQDDHGKDIYNEK
jgi:KDO2-lipid IV(A) lauroyltransferase